MFHAWIMRRHLQPAVRLAPLLILMTAASGCVSSLHRQGRAVSEATAPVVDHAASAYRDANTLHDLRVDYDAVARFDATDAVYNPRSIETLLSERDIDARLAVIAALQEYAKTLVAITSGTDSPALQAAARSVGDNLSSFANLLASSPSSPSSTQVSPITPDVQSGISAALDALGQFLVSRKVSRDLPPIIMKMDPHVQALCALLERDVDILQQQERSDFNRIIDQQTLFLRQNAKMDPEERRAEIMKLPGFVRQQRAAEEKLVTFRTGLIRLAKTHRELAAAAQDRNSESATQKLEELASAGRNLGSFYLSLPAN